MKYLYFIICSAVLSIQTSFGQFYPTVNFEQNSTTPANKAYNSNDTVIAGGKKWTMLGTRLGVADNGDFKFNDRSARLGKENENTGYNGCMTMQEDFPFGIHDIFFYGAMYGNHTGGTVDVFVSTNGGSSWINEASITMPANSQPDLFNVHKHYYGNVRIKICKSDAGSGIINIDSIYVEQMAVPPANLSLQFKQPTGNNINPYHYDSLMISYNQHIEAGIAGNITLVEENGPSQNFAVNDPNVNIYDEYIIVSNINLKPSKNYQVLVDAGFVVSEYANLPNDAIVANEWTFSTNIGAYDSFHIAVNAPCSGNDTFDNVLVRKDLLGNSDKWQCLNEAGATYYSIKPVPVSGNNYDENEDWMVTVFPVNFGDSSILSFTETRIGSGSNAIRGIYYAADYKGSVNTVAWTPLATLGNINDNQTLEKTISLTNLPVERAYIGFKYTNQPSNINAAYEWRISNIKYKQAQIISTNDIKNNAINMTLLGMGNTQQVQIAIETKKADNIKMLVYDVAGKLIKQQTIMLQQGYQILTFNNLVNAAGMYLMKVYNDEMEQTIKIPVAY